MDVKNTEYLIFAFNIDKRDDFFFANIYFFISHIDQKTVKIHGVCVCRKIQFGAIQG